MDKNRKKAFTFKKSCHSVALAKESSLPAGKDVTSINISDLDCHGESKCLSRLAMTCNASWIFLHDCSILLRSACRRFCNRHFGSSPYAKSAFTFAELMVSLVIISVITALLYPVIANIAPNNNKQLYRSAYKTVESVMQDIITSEGNNTNGIFDTVACIDDGAGGCRNQDAIDAANANAGNEISHTLCQEFQKRLNTVKWNVYDSCDNAAPQELHTSNGMRWWFQEAKPCTNNRNLTCFTIYVDVNASNNGENFNSVRCNTDSCASDKAACDAKCNAADNNCLDACKAAQRRCNNRCQAPFDDPVSFGTNGSWTKGCFRQHDDNGRDTFKIEVQSNGRVNPAVDQIGIRHLRNESLDQQQ